MTVCFSGDTVQKESLYVKYLIPREGRNRERFRSIFDAAGIRAAQKEPPGELVAWAALSGPLGVPGHGPAAILPRCPGDKGFQLKPTRRVEHVLLCELKTEG